MGEARNRVSLILPTKIRHNSGLALIDAARCRTKANVKAGGRNVKQRWLLAV